MSIPIQTVRTDSFSMDYFCFGSGPKNLVILPGLSVQSVMGFADAVADAYQSLTEQFTIYLFDCRRELPGSYSIHQMARDTYAAMQACGLRSVCLFGASMGGMTAMVLAIEHPELVERMILGSTSANIVDFHLFQSWIDLARQRDRAGLYLSFAQAIYPPQVLEQCREMLLRAAETVTDAELERFIVLAEAIRGFREVDELTRIQCPVLAVGSFDDDVLGADATMEIAERLDERPDVRLYLYTGFGHAAYDTAPDYRQRMLQFLTE